MSLLLSHKELMFNSGFLSYPVLELEEKFEASTDDHVQRQKETGKFLKKLGKNTPDFDNLWKLSLVTNSSLHNLKYVENTAFTIRSLESLAEIYADFDLSLQDFNKALNKLKKSNKDVYDYYTSFSDSFDVNVFSMYAEDLKSNMSNAQERYSVYASRNGLNKELDVNFDDMLAYYKVAIKKIKEDRDKIKNS